MMRIQMESVWASPTFNRQPGDIVEVSTEVAKALVGSRCAIALDEWPVEEVEAQAPKAEKAVRKRNVQKAVRGV